MKTFLLAIALLGSCVLVANAETKLKVGDSAPKITATDHEEKTWKLESLLGKKNVLIYFYPKDDTPGCTKQACTLRDRMGDLQKEDVEVVGVSFDDAKSHRAFREKYDLNFTLLADTDGKVADAFGARRGPDAKIARRVSFLIGKDGKIKHITDAPSADVHLSEMKEAIEKLKG